MAENRVDGPTSTTWCKNEALIAAASTATLLLSQSTSQGAGYPISDNVHLVW
jgi:hypothetical protein